MRRVFEQKPSKQALQIAKVLEEVGFNLQLLGSEKYVLKRLRVLNPPELGRVKDAFIRNKIPRIMKYFFRGIPYGHQKIYAEKIMDASLDRLAHLIKVCGFLLQTEIYLFWSYNALIG